MKCPRCGEELQRSKKDPNYGLCYNCRKKFKLVNENNFDIEDDTPTVPNKRKKKKEKRGGCLKIFGIVFAVFVVIGVISSLYGSDEQEKKNDATEVQETDGTQDDGTQSETVQENKPDVPIEYQNALTKAEQYSENLYMSKQGIYDQLTSEYGEQFSEEAAQYAVDNLQANYKENALEKAKQYQEQMAMSSDAIRDQLISENGEKFTEEEADYAISNLPQ